MKKNFLILLPFIAGLYACSNNVEITAIAVKLVRNYDENNKYIDSHFEEFDNAEYKYTMRFEKDHIFSADDMGSLDSYLFENVPESCTTIQPDNQGYDYIVGYYYDLNMKEDFFVNTKIESNISIYFAFVSGPDTYIPPYLSRLQIGC